MKKIGLMSDTHSYLDPKIFEYFKDCDEIWHAGDFGNAGIVEELRKFKPLRGVYGNIDGPDVRVDMPEINRFTLEGLDVVIIHIGGYPGKYTLLAQKTFAEQVPGLFISGHSHILKIIFDEKNNCLHINPGAAGKHGWHTVRTLIRFNILNGTIRDCEVIELPR
ncbi:MAG: metallophosphoesterase [Chitinophagaceae bacterium]|nr:MAG: metallophosphoesterase [Chitinophagaceae bacterium]